MPRFNDISQYTPWGDYAIDVTLHSLERTLIHWKQDWNVNLDPDFQRAHVWTRDQQIAFVEFLLRGGKSGCEILFNCPGWHAGEIGDFVLVDGKQRLTACLAFLHDEIPAFGHYRSEYQDEPARLHMRLKLHVNALKTRAEVLRWYLELNAGGTPHTPEELARVQALLAKEQS